MSAPRVAPRKFIRPDETPQAFAVRLAQTSTFSSREIAMVTGLHHTTVLYLTNSEFRRDKIIAEHRKRARMTPTERRDESIARRFRADSTGRGQ